MVDDIYPSAWDVLGILEKEMPKLLHRIKTDFEYIASSWDIE
jgi:hypothetical protein